MQRGPIPESGALALLFGLLVATSPAAWADGEFLTDYARLIPSPDTAMSRYYLAPGATAELPSYKRLMVDQPEIFVADDSPYQGITPAHMDVIAESLRASAVEALSARYEIVEEAGPGVLYLRLALVDVKVDKKRTKVLGYTPIGLVVRGARDVAATDFENAVRHVSLASVKIEGEVSDSQSASVLAEFVDDFSGDSTPQSWAELQSEMQRFAGVIECQFENAGLAAGQRSECRNSGN